MTTEHATAAPRFTLYTYGNTPSALPLSHVEPDWDVDAVRAAGFDPNDEEVTISTLAEPWNGHPAGALVVTGLTTEGHPFAVETPEQTTEQEQPRRGFYHLSRAWYAAANIQPDRVDEVTFGLYYVDGGAEAEMSMTWHDLGSNGLAPCLEVFSDAWRVLAGFRDVINALAEHDGQNITPDAFCARLRSLGFADLMPIECPYDA